MVLKAKEFALHLLTVALYHGYNSNPVSGLVDKQSLFLDLSHHSAG